MNNTKSTGIPFSAVALSIAVAALAEPFPPALPQTLLQGAAAAVMLGTLAAWVGICCRPCGLLGRCIYRTVLAVLLVAELVQTAVQAQYVCRQEFASMALIGLLPLLLWAGWKLPLSGWEAPARVLWWLAALGGAVCVLGLWGQMHWERLVLLPDGAAGEWTIPLYAEYFLLPVLGGEQKPCRTLFLPMGTYCIRMCAALSFALVFGASRYPARELLRAWSVGAFSRMDAFLILIWFCGAMFRICFLAAMLRQILQESQNSNNPEGARK